MTAFEFSILNDGKLAVVETELRTSGLDLILGLCYSFCNNRARVRLLLLLDIK